MPGARSTLSVEFRPPAPQLPSSSAQARPTAGEQELSSQSLVSKPVAGSQVLAVMRPGTLTTKP
jgi:hypothetical protein